VSVSVWDPDVVSVAIPHGNAAASVGGGSCA
jgi:hypothetical protein